MYIYIYIYIYTYQYIYIFIFIYIYISSGVFHSSTRQQPQQTPSYKRGGGGTRACALRLYKCISLYIFYLFNYVIYIYIYSC